MAERANYYDVGRAAEHRQGPDRGTGLPTTSSRHNLIDEGQFGAPIILTPFNYLYGQQYGVESHGQLHRQAFSAYGNLASQSAMGKDIDSAQFNFSPDDLAYIADTTSTWTTSRSLRPPAASPTCC